MSLDERLFRWLWKKRQRFGSKHTLERERLFGVGLAENRYRFSLIAFALAGQWLEIAQAERAGGFIGERLYLPRILCLTDDSELNQIAFFYRIAFSITSYKMSFRLPRSLARAPERRLMDFAVIPAVESRLQRDFPGLWERVAGLKQAILSQRPPVSALNSERELFEALNQYFLGRPFPGHAPGFNPVASFDAILRFPFPLKEEGILPLWGRLALSDEGPAGKQSTENPEQTVPEAASRKTEKEKAAAEGAKLVEFDADNPEQMPVQLVIEQLQTLEKFMGGKKTADASDELESHSEALEEVDVREVCRGKKQTQSIFRSDPAFSPAEVEMADAAAQDRKTYFYDEWDYRKRAYRPRWCQVTERIIPRLKEGSQVKEEIASIRKKYRKETVALKRRLDSLLLSRSWKKRQTLGEEIDLDQIVDRHASLKSGHSPPEKLYVSRRKSERDLAVLVLLDASLSTGSWIGGQEVMTIAKETLVILHQAFANLSGRIAMAAFYSHTRTRCAFVPLKDFKEDWDRITQGRLMSLEPAGYTRIGPALRHAITKMRKKSAARKAILLVTDGKPADYDAYEGRHGIEDVRQAVREAGGSAIGVFGLAIDQRARTYFPRMFGRRQFEVIGQPGELPQKLMKWYLKLFYGS